MTVFSRHIYFRILIIISLTIIPTIAYADDGILSSTAANLGWIAIGCGVAANLSLVAFKMMKKVQIINLAVGSVTSQRLTSMYQPVLNFHIMLNAMGFFAGLSHGFILIRGLDYVSLSMATIMTVSMISGIILKFSSGKNIKFVSRLVHGQGILAAMLVTLVILHVITRWHHGIIMHFI